MATITITKTKTRAKCPTCGSKMVLINAQFRFCEKCTPINDKELSAKMLRNQKKREKEENVTVWTSKKFSQEFLQQLIDECR